MDGRDIKERSIILSDLRQRALDLHKKYKGKLATSIKPPVNGADDLSLLYSPGVGEVSKEIAQNLESAKLYTGLSNTVAVISDGSAVLGLGNIGPVAGLPVMEGKALLFKHFADIDSVPVVLDVHTADEIVATCKAIAPSFGAINLEDIKAPLCFEVEERLKEDLDIPVFHDDQHGTAIVVLAGLINSMKVVGKELNSTKITLVGAGAAGIAIAKIIKKYASGAEIVLVDSKGIVSKDRQDLNKYKQGFAVTAKGNLQDAVKDSDIFIGVSKPGLLTAELIATMNSSPVVFALANPDPEVLPEAAKKAGVAVIATGRSDLPNQVNNALVFPGIFRGALDNGVSKITDGHKIKAAKVLAAVVASPSADEIVPSIFTEGIVETISKEIV